MLVHLDNSLKDHVGHYYNLAASLRDEAARRGIDYRVLVHRDATPMVRSTLPASPVFRHDFHHALWQPPVLRAGDPKGTRYDYLRANAEFYRDLGPALRGVGGADTVLMPMASHRELLAWEWWMRGRAPVLSPELVLMFRLNYLDILDENHWEQVREVASRGFRSLERVASMRRVRVATDSDRLARELEHLIDLPVEVFPIPHTEHGRPAAPRRRAPGEPMHFVTLGDLREEKGFPLLTAALMRLHERGALAGMRFTIQAHIGSAWHAHMADHRRALEELRLPGVELLPEPLDTEGYYGLIDSADAVVIPYDRRTYYSRTSGPLVEAFAAGKAVIATDDTWMSAQIHRFGAGITFRDHDPDDLARALLEARITYDDLMDRAAANQHTWLRFHTPGMFLDTVMRGGEDAPATELPPAGSVRRAVESALVGGALRLAERRGATSAAERIYQTDSVRWLRFHRNRLELARGPAEPTIDHARVANALPNNGPLELEREFGSAQEVVAEYSDPANRSQEIEGYEGFAPDDAVFDPVTESHEVWSNADFAAEIARIAYRHGARPRVLDVGCGPAHLFFFLARYGIADYVGIDGNPMLLRFVPHVEGFEDRFHILDLQQEIRLEEDGAPLRFDVVCSFEVLEHIHEDRLEDFLATVRNHMRPGATFLCTASTLPTMDVHVLVRDRAWWVRRFAQAGLEPHPEATAFERALGGNPPFNWTEETTNVFALRLADAH